MYTNENKIAGRHAGIFEWYIIQINNTYLGRYKNKKKTPTYAVTCLLNKFLFKCN